MLKQLRTAVPAILRKKTLARQQMQKISAHVLFLFPLYCVIVCYFYYFYCCLYFRKELFWLEQNFAPTALTQALESDVFVCLSVFLYVCMCYSMALGWTLADVLMNF
jgi:hypothetical protein